MKRIFFAVVVLCFWTAVLGGLVRIGISSFIREPYTGPANQLLNRLRTIEAAKENWRRGHPGIHPETLKEQDLAPYLSQDFWKRKIAGERYIIHTLDELPEAVTTRAVDWLPRGMKVRFSPDPDGKVEVRPNYAMHTDSATTFRFESAITGAEPVMANR